MNNAYLSFDDCERLLGEHLIDLYIRLPVFPPEYSPPWHRVQERPEGPIAAAIVEFIKEIRRDVDWPYLVITDGVGCVCGFWFWHDIIIWQIQARPSNPCAMTLLDDRDHRRDKASSRAVTRQLLVCVSLQRVWQAVGHNDHRGRRHLVLLCQQPGQNKCEDIQVKRENRCAQRSNNVPTTWTTSRMNTDFGRYWAELILSLVTIAGLKLKRSMQLIVSR